jgi:hypothetical protein
MDKTVTITLTQEQRRNLQDWLEQIRSGYQDDSMPPPPYTPDEDPGDTDNWANWRELTEFIELLANHA